MRILFLISAVVIFIACSVSEPKVEMEKFGSPAVNNSDSLIDTVKAYTSAIREYLKEYCKNDKPDTLFLGKNPEFPDITLPASVENTALRIIVTEEGHQIAKRRPMLILNMISWLTNNKAEFMLVTFKDGFDPQFNCSMYFTYINAEFKLDSLKLIKPYEKARTRSH